MFFDEFGFSFQEPLGRTWAPRGKPPLIRRTTRYRREISTAVGLTRSGKIYLRHFFHAMHAVDTIAALEHIRHRVSGGFILVWDHAPTHRAKVVQAYLKDYRDIRVEWLPSYAPDLNPEEYGHGNVKQHLQNVLPDDKFEIRRLLNQEFARLRRRPDLLLSFFHHAGLRVRQLT